MSKLRSVNTKFWDDPFIQDLTPSEKLLFLYLLTNPLVNLVGVYEISIRRISFDTGLNESTITKGFERFETVEYDKNYVILYNRLKNQHLNKNMKVAVYKEFDGLPNWLKIKLVGQDHETIPNDSKGFEILCERFEKKEVEVESEIEVEDECEDRKGSSEPTPTSNKIYWQSAHLKLYHSEYEKLIEEHDKKIIDEKLERLANYRGNKKYKSAYLTIKNWLKDGRTNENKDNRPYFEDGREPVLYSR